MKKNSFTEFFKGKGYYVLLFVGILAIAAVALVGTRLSAPDDEGKNFVDLNEPNNNIADQSDNLLANNDPASDEIVNNDETDNLQADANDELVVDDPVTNDELIEHDVFTEAEEDGIDLASQEDLELEVPEVMETSGTTVQAESKPVVESLSFDADAGLLWPVDGNVLMNYSMDHTIYHATLMQYKCNPAIIIDAEVGTEVKAATRGVVTSIDTNEETGLTVTTNIGDGYSLVYGQLENVNLKVGDKVDEGKVLGTVSDPTKYYVMEGSNLYFQVLNEEETVNPMTLLR